MSAPALEIVDLAAESATLAPGLPSRVIARINESCLRMSVFSGEGTWHAHPTSDELFLVFEGELLVDVHGGPTAAVGPRQIATVPAGVVHRPRAAAASVILCFKHFVAETAFYEVNPTSGDASNG